MATNIEDQNSVPKRYTSSGRSFVQALAGSVNNSTMGDFSAFPQGVDFNGKEAAEEVILLVRKDLAALLPQYLLILALIIAPLFFVGIFGALGLSGGSSAAFSAATIIIFWLLAFTAGVDTFLKWFYSVNIITDQRIIDVDFNNVLYHRFSDASIEKIEDVTHSVDGFLGSVFDYGSVYIQTAGTRTEFEFKYIPRPRDVQDVLFDLVEMKQSGEI